jgi:hypothetical protein
MATAVFPFDLCDRSTGGGVIVPDLPETRTTKSME